MSEHEPEWERDRRLKGEEARMVQLESTMSAIRTQTDAIHEMFVEERKLRRAAEEALLKHESEDSTKFASIDSRLQGIQTQLSTISSANERIERKVEVVEPRLTALETEGSNRSAVHHWLSSVWVHMAAGGGMVAAIAGIIALLRGGP